MASGPQVRHTDRKSWIPIAPWCYCQAGSNALWRHGSKIPRNTGRLTRSWGIYALAARDGAPQAIQVADRWHLLKNIGDALERMMYRHMPLIRLVATGVIPPKNRMLKRLWCQRQRYVALNVLNESDVTNGISAGLR